MGPRTLTQNKQTCWNDRSVADRKQSVALTRVKHCVRTCMHTCMHLIKTCGLMSLMIETTQGKTGHGDIVSTNEKLPAWENRHAFSFFRFSFLVGLPPPISKKPPFYTITCACSLDKWSKSFLWTWHEGGSFPKAERHAWVTRDFFMFWGQKKFPFGRYLQYKVQGKIASKCYL